MMKTRTLALALALFLAALGLPAANAGDPPTVNWLPYAEAFNQARELDRPVLVYFWQDGCRPCEMLAKNGFNRPEIAAYINQNLTPARVNINTQPDLARRHRIAGTPVVWFFSPAGREIDFIVGYVTPERLTLILHYIGDGAYKVMKFSEYEREKGGGK